MRRLNGKDPVFGVVSLLDYIHCQHVENLWHELEHRYGIRGSHATPFPHISYHVANSYQTDKLSAVLEQFAQDSTSFTITTSGLGVFTGELPVIYIPVVRSMALSEIQLRLWIITDPCGQDAVAHYAPESWLPHITLGQAGGNEGQLARAVEWLAAQPLSWEVPIDNVALLGSSSAPYELRFKYAL